MDEQLHTLASVFEASSRQLITDDQTGVPRFQAGGWESTLNILKTFDFQTPKIVHTTKVYPRFDKPFVEVNEEYANLLIENISCVVFTNFYPNIIVSLIEQGKLPYESPLREFYHVVKLRPALKKLQMTGKLTPEGNQALKVWINYMYGMMPKHNYDTGIVSGFARVVLEHVKEMGLRWYYVNKDELWVRAKDVSFTEVEMFGLPFEVLQVDQAVFISKEKYIAKVRENNVQQTLISGFKRERWESRGSIVGKSTGIL